MAILFDWYENPKNKERQNEELTLHPRIRLNGSTDTAALRRFIQEYCSLTETDVLAVLDALSHFMGRELGEGRQVHLDGIGYFRPTLTCTEPVKVDTKRKSTKVKLKSITFRPDMALRSEVGNIKVLPLKQRNVLQKPLTPEEIDKRLEKFFTTHDFMTKSITFRPDMALRSEVGNIKVLPLKQRNVLQKPLTPEEIDKRLEKFFTTHDFMTKGDFYSLTGMTRTTATRHIRRLCDEGKLENKGLQKQPIYVQKKA